MQGNNQYWDAIQFQERANGKSFPQKVGSAKPREDGGFDLYLNVLPFPNKDGVVKIVISRPREQSTGAYSRTTAGGGYQKPQARGPRNDDLDDSIPF